MKKKGPLRAELMVTVTDEAWPYLRIHVKAGLWETSGQSLYDTALTNFESTVSNALRRTMDGLIRARKDSK